MAKSVGLVFCTVIFYAIGCSQIKQDNEAKMRLQHLTMDKLVGVNAFVDDPAGKLTAFGFIREYHLWQWDEGNGDPSYQGFPSNKMAWSPSKTGWDFDQFYKSLQQLNIEVSPCLQGAAPWLQLKKNSFPQNQKPTDGQNYSTTDPRSYKARAYYLYQFAARYGSTPISPNLLALNHDQESVSALKYINYMEDWNEPDKFWEGAEAKFKPEEYAAMLSADYDGHCGQLRYRKLNFGVKNADPSMKLVMGGLADPKLSYITKMNRWFKKNRPDKKFAADVINVHLYAWKDGVGWQGGGPAQSPEDAKFKEKMTRFCRYRDRHWPEMEVWVSEFGWDTNPDSPLAPPKIGRFERDEVQAQWLVRAYLSFAAAGVDKAQMYMFRDVDSHNSQWFSSSGVVSEKGKWDKKKSWYYIAALKNTLANMHFIGEGKSGNKNTLIYKFKDKNSSKGVYVIWNKTSSDYQIKDFILPIKPTHGNTKIVRLSDKSANGSIELHLQSEQTIKITITESPIFVCVENIE